ncbi:hypothetical protein C8F01DRAFT_161841 [Mycena amicta]|nr:hypothetical protein C8F01DRAFT_161841 [Mycena amicta]
MLKLVPPHTTASSSPRNGSTRCQQRRGTYSDCRYPEIYVVYTKNACREAIWADVSAYGPRCVILMLHWSRFITSVGAYACLERSLDCSIFASPLPRCAIYVPATLESIHRAFQGPLVPFVQRRHELPHINRTKRDAGAEYIGTWVRAHSLRLCVCLTRLGLSFGILRPRLFVVQPSSPTLHRGLRSTSPAIMCSLRRVFVPWNSWRRQYPVRLNSLPIPSHNFYTYIPSFLFRRC